MSCSDLLGEIDLIEAADRVDILDSEDAGDLALLGNA